MLTTTWTVPSTLPFTAFPVATQVKFALSPISLVFCFKVSVVFQVSSISFRLSGFALIISPPLWIQTNETWGFAPTTEHVRSKLSWLAETFTRHPVPNPESQSSVLINGCCAIAVTIILIMLHMCFHKTYRKTSFRGAYGHDPFWSVSEEYPLDSTRSNSTITVSII